jgi:hypothetical protein
MALYTWLVFTNCTAGHEAEYDAWYDDVHVPDLLRIPGVQSATRCAIDGTQGTMAGERLMLSTPEGIGAKHRYLTSYKVETDDIGAFIEEVGRRANTPDMILSPYMEDPYTLMYRDVG